MLFYTMASEFLELLKKDKEVMRELSERVAAEIVLQPEFRKVLARTAAGELATKEDLRKTEQSLRTDIKNVEERLRAEIKEIEEKLRAEIREVESSLRAEIALNREEIKNVESSMRAEIKETEEKLRAEIKESEERLKSYVDARISDVVKAMQISFTVLCIMIAGFALLVGLR